MVVWENEEITKRNKEGFAYFHQCFEEPCCGNGQENDCDDCGFMEGVCQKLAQYEDIGTLEEVRKAVEKQNAEKPKAYRLESHGVYDGRLYCCPNCECSIIKQDNRGFFSGPMAKHCLNCGQKLDWTEVEK